MFAEMTARELAEKLLAMPDPDSVVSVRVESWEGQVILDHLMFFNVEQSLTSDSPTSAIGWITLATRIEP